jgi:hypothetical protein
MSIKSFRMGDIEGWDLSMKMDKTISLELALLDSELLSIVFYAEFKKV